MSWRMWRIHQAEKNLPVPFFILLFVVTAVVCFGTWVMGNKQSTSMYEKLSTVIEQQAEEFQSQGGK